MLGYCPLDARDFSKLIKSHKEWREFICFGKLEFHTDGDGGRFLRRIRPGLRWFGHLTRLNFRARVFLKSWKKTWPFSLRRNFWPLGDIDLIRFTMCRWIHSMCVALTLRPCFSGPRLQQYGFVYSCLHVPYLSIIIQTTRNDISQLWPYLDKLHLTSQ